MAKRKLPPALAANKFKKNTKRAKQTGNKKNKGGMPAALKAKLRKGK